MMEKLEERKTVFLLLNLLIFLCQLVGVVTEDFPKGHLQPFGAHKPPIKGVIDEVDKAPSSADFYKNYIKKSRPLLIKGGGNRWPAVDLWPDEEYLLENFGEEVFRVDLRKVWDDKHPPRMNMYMKDFLDIYKKKDIYLDSPFPRSGMLHDAFVPTVLECEELFAKVDSASLLFSSGNTSYVFHQDGYENIITLIAGQKTFLIAHPKDGHKVYANQFTTMPGLSPIEPEKVDLVKFPKVADLDYYEVHMEAGDQLYIPIYWWHQVRSYKAPNIAISLWFYFFNHEDELDEAGVDPDIQVEESVSMYMDYIKTQPENLECKKKVRNKKLAVVMKENNAEDTQNVNVMVQEPPDKLLASGYTIPVIGFGTGQFAIHDEFQDKVYDVVRYALTVGYRMFDTAQGYPQSEEGLGRAIKDSGIPRSEIIIVDKIHPKYAGFDATIKSVEESLHKLQTNYIDVVLIHSPDCDDFILVCDMDSLEGTWKDTWKGLEKLQKDGKIRSIGVSNFEVDQLEELMEIAEVPISVVQNWFDILHLDKDVREFCADHNIQYMGFSILGTQWTMNDFTSVNPVLENPLVQHIAIRQQRTEANIIIRWAMYKNVIVLTSSKNEHNIVTNFQSLEVLLNADDIRDIETTPEIDLDKLYAAMDKYEAKTPEKDRKPLTNDFLEFVRTYRIEDDEAVDDDGDVNATDGSCEAGEDCSERERSKYSAEENEDFDAEVEWVKPEHPGSEVTLFEKVNLDEETIYFGAEDSYMYALDATTGQVQWKFLTSHSDLGSSPAFSRDNKVIYFGGEDGYFYALSAEDGNVQWTFETDNSIISSPAVGKEGTIYFASLDGFMYALTPDGKLKWKKDMYLEMWSSPTVLSFEDGELVYIPQMGGEGHNIHALDGKDGSVVFKFADGEDGFFASPRLSLDNTTVYFCGLNGYVYARNAYSGKLIKKTYIGSGSEINTTPAVGKKGLIIGTSKGELVGLDREKLAVIWKKKFGGSFMSSPFLGPNRQIYIGTGDGRIVAVNYTDGSILWEMKTGDSDVWSSPSLDKEGRLFIGVFDGNMYALNSTTGEILWKTLIGQAIVSRPLITTKYRELTFWERNAIKSKEEP
ncbi:uncharacterized protein LOC144451416 [Glandiceps talaboti]